jgi:hypothetical protein
MDEVRRAQSGLGKFKSLRLPFAALEVFSPEQGSLHTQLGCTESIQYMKALLARLCKGHGDQMKSI